MTRRLPGLSIARLQLAVAAVRGAFSGAVGAVVTWLIDHLGQR
ncbi:hypothetical protein ACPZ19_10020 [Amycolatopsis lurida]